MLQFTATTASSKAKERTNAKNDEREKKMLHWKKKELCCANKRIQSAPYIQWKREIEATEGISYNENILMRTALFKPIIIGEWGTKKFINNSQRTNESLRDALMQREINTAAQAPIIFFLSKQARERKAK